MASFSRRRGPRHDYSWPGYVDALSSLLMVVIFVLSVFVVAQFYLSEALGSRDQALAQLNKKMAELASILQLEQTTNADLRKTIAQLTDQLGAATSARDRLSADLDKMTAQRDQLAVDLDKANAQRSQLAAALDKANAQNAQISAALDKAGAQNTRLAADLDKSNAQRTQLSADLDKANAQRTQLAADLDKAKGERDQVSADLGKANDDLKTAAANLRKVTGERDQMSTDLDRANADLKKSNEARDQLSGQVATLQADKGKTQEELTEQQKLSAEAKRTIEQLSANIAALKAELARLNAALDASDLKAKDQQAQIVDLSQRLNRALVNKVEELARYRSEFFGKLSEVLGKRKDIIVVGDRFVFQSEVLFSSGSADLGPEGIIKLADVADALKEIADKIPPDIDWVLQVDGHTDTKPIHTVQFPSNWELSAARAIAVVEFLHSRGIPYNRLAARGFAEFQPLTDGTDQASMAKNRRIELKITTR